MDQQMMFPMIMLLAVGFAIFRRVRRNIGRQPLKSGLLVLRVVVFGLIGTMFLVRGFGNMEMLGALLGGAAAGAALGWLGLRHTQFERTPEGDFYTPHTYIGLAVSLLLIGRLAYRFYQIYPAMQAAHAQQADTLAAFQRSPLTMAIFGVMIGYYVCYYAGVLYRARSRVAVA